MKRLTIGGVLLVAAIGASLLVTGAFASVKGAKVAPKVEASTITVTAGKPIEWAFALSSESVRPGPVAFKVTNEGFLLYRFEICSAPGRATVCFGSSTPQIDPGKTVTLSVKLPKGTYEYIGTADDYVTQTGNLTVTSSAKATPKTVVPKTSVGQTTPKQKTTTTTPKTSSGKTTTTTPSSSSKSSSPTTTTTTTPTAPPPAQSTPVVGDPSAGASLFQQAGCASCHTLKAAGATGTVGPNLDQVAPDESTVITNVTYGNAMGMPAFSPQYSAAQIQDIAAYVYDSTH